MEGRTQDSFMKVFCFLLLALKYPGSKKKNNMKGSKQTCCFHINRIFISTVCKSSSVVSPISIGIASSNHLQILLNSFTFQSGKAAGV